MIGDFRFYCPTEIIFGRGRIAELPGRLVALGVRRVFLLFDPALPTLDYLCSILASGTRLEIIQQSAGQIEPTLDSVEGVVDAAHDARCDAVVAVGGGSVLDTGKVAAAAAANPAMPYRSFFTDGIPSNTELPLVAVPTTAGTGAEVTRGVAIIDTAFGVKVGFAKGGYHPRIAILDADFTDDLPPSITATTGLDAFCQALEAYLSPRAFATTDCFALPALRLIAENFDSACRGHPAARGAMLAAATFAALSFSTGSGLTFSHHFSDLAGPRLKLRHGHAAALLLSGVLEQASRSQPTRFGALVAALGGTNADDVKTKAIALVARAGAPPLDSLVTMDEALALAEQSLAYTDSRSPFSRDEALETVRLSFESRTALHAQKRR